MWADMLIWANLARLNLNDLVFRMVRLMPLVLSATELQALLTPASAPTTHPIPRCRYCVART
jgi:hypothetical protein